MTTIKWIKLKSVNRKGKKGKVEQGQRGEKETCINMKKKRKMKK